MNNVIIFYFIEILKALKDVSISLNNSNISKEMQTLFFYQKMLKLKHLAFFFFNESEDTGSV